MYSTHPDDFTCWYFLLVGMRDLPFEFRLPVPFLAESAATETIAFGVAVEMILRMLPLSSGSIYFVNIW